MIGISATLFDLDGHLRVKPIDGTDVYDIERRASRVRTLDGGAAINDRGHSPADRTFRITWRPSGKAEERQAQRLLRLHSSITITTDEGIFRGTPERLQIADRVATLTVLIKEQLI